MTWIWVGGFFTPHFFNSFKFTLNLPVGSAEKRRFYSSPLEGSVRQSLFLKSFVLFDLEKTKA